MDANAVIVEQFDRGAAWFDTWSVTGDERMLEGLAEFCGLTEDDDVLDVACGTGAFALHAAGRVRSVTGVDISTGMIGVARDKAVALGLGNVEFVRSDVARLDLGADRFSPVVSRSAFHHMPLVAEVFAGMVRCARPGGVVCVQDVMAYGDEKVDAFFERLEAVVDRSHHRSLGKREFFDLYRANGVALEALFESESLLDVAHYIEHVEQTEENRAQVDRLVREGLGDPDIAPWFVQDGDRLRWRRRVCTIKGRKAEADQNHRIG
ncbi:class I SAM-dependent methyltransferase [Actinokineospora sp. PR83]|uniref:class I SAM-dependent methyltransferase n=1 Tax=Actinokineospora sp. PR83 TaxID=2884908 RepID=UPI0027E0218F|nr:class I SAM-dependent methyltransferase [Actinokineospora sp. PR83]MCG8915264.1 class I SAM-dependent methyltransferase [Actinokineospora sp. PR83]